MRNLIIITLLCGCQLTFGEDIAKRDGTVYRNVTIISADPMRMLIAHAGGGCQVEYKDLASGALSEQQQKEIAEGLRAYAERQGRLEQTQLAAEKLRLEQEAYEREQLAQGMIHFEGMWMKPADRQEIMASRELDRLKQERLSVELEQQKAELQKAQILAEQERKRLEEYDRSRRYSYSYSYPSTRTVYVHGYPNHYKTPSHRYSGSHHSSHYRPGGLSFSIGSHGSSVSFSSGSSCRTGVGISIGHGSGHSSGRGRR
ncbi:MAG: hypothetical protein K9M45_07980 [Kiritimatiellales bacterium]|nr:hypothetical protein [Kiritimatiellales bacterium]